MTSLTVASETDEAVFPWTDKKASDMQENIVVSNNAITGTLKFIEGGLSPSGPLAGDGYFIALTLADNDFEDLESVKVGFVPSEGTGLVEMIDDPDKNMVGKIANKDTQIFTVVQTAADGRKKTQRYDLSGLTLEAEG